MLTDLIILKKLELDFVIIEFYAPDLIVYHYKPQTHLTWQMIQQVAKETNEMINYKKCFMCSVIGEDVTIDKAVREKGTTPEALAYTKASAIVQNSLAHRILGNFIIKVQRPSVPTKLFNDIHVALTWLNKLRLQEQ